MTDHLRFDFMEQLPSTDRLPWRENLGLIAGVLSVVFVALKLMAVASNDPETAYAILQAEGTGSVIVGSLISAVGLIVMPIAMIFVYIDQKTKEANAATMIGAPALSFIAFLTAPALQLITVTALSIFAGLALAFRRWARSLSRELGSSAMTSTTSPRRARFRIKPIEVAIVYVMLVMASEAVIATPSLPLENISIRGEKQFSAYILSETTTTTVILASRPVEVVRLPSSSIVDAEICRPSNYFFQQATLAQWLHVFIFGAPHYPRCRMAFGPVAALDAKSLQERLLFKARRSGM